MTYWISIGMIVTSSVFANFASAYDVEFSALLEHEYAYELDHDGQKSETLFQPEWNIELSEDTNLTLIGRARFDSLAKLGQDHNDEENFSSENGAILHSENAELSIREWYIDTQLGNSFWRVGKQQVVWGQADGLRVLDVVNPQSFREFTLDDFDDSRIPLWMLNVELPIGDEGSLQALWVPDLSYNKLADAGSPYQVTSPIFVPQRPSETPLVGYSRSRPRSRIKDADFGLRYSLFYQGWDLSLNYFHHYHDNPVLYQFIDNTGVRLESRYERNHLVGGTASNAFGSFTLRLELAYNTDTYHQSRDSTVNGVHQTAELASVVGLDWQGLSDTLLSVQWFQSHLIDDSSFVVRPQDNSILSLLLRRTFLNETWELEWLSLYGVDQKDGSIQAKLQYSVRDNVQLWVGADLFTGDKAGLFGQFKDRDRLTAGVEFGF